VEKQPLHSKVSTEHAVTSDQVVDAFHCMWTESPGINSTYCFTELSAFSRVHNDCASPVWMMS